MAGIYQGPNTLATGRADGPLRDLFKASAAGPVAAPPPVTKAAPGARVTEAYDAWWWFACERQRIYFRRLEGKLPPWTDDPILRRHRFTNAYRVADRVSQYLIRHVIYRDDLPGEPSEVVFRILLFKLFNRIETWEAVTSRIGAVALSEKPFERIDGILNDELAAGRPIYSAAYIMPTVGAAKGRKHRMHLALLEQMMKDHLAERLAESKNMEAAFNLLRAYPGIGDFLAYQFITDINYSDVVDFSETEFVVAGPGAREGLRKCFADAGGVSDADLIRMMMEVQEEEFQRLGLGFRDLFGRHLQLIDCQNVFCEVAKFARVRFPQLNPPKGRTRIKQTYEPSSALDMPFFPPKWEINDTVRLTLRPIPLAEHADLAEYQRQAQATSHHSTDRGVEDVITPILGLIGETGEVVSELKKRHRDGDGYPHFRDRLVEELGDLLWYVADLATRRGISLADIPHRSATPSSWISPALALAEQVGGVAIAYDSLLARNHDAAQFDALLSSRLTDVLNNIEAVMSANGITPAEVMCRNLAKIERRQAPSKSPSDLPPEQEQLPKRFDAHLTDHDRRVSVLFVVDGQKSPIAANTLTDNSYDPDGYRFHDIFHFAYAAVLAWSPVTRSLLRRKRKSTPLVDEVEDGGRAAAIEEGISAMVFAYAQQHRMLAGVYDIDESLLRTIREMTQHLEIKERTQAEWRDAILQGFNAWRSVHSAGGGCVRADLETRRIFFIGSEEATVKPRNPELPFVYVNNK